MITEDWRIEGWFGPCWILGETPIWNRNLKPWKEFLEANVSLWQPYDPLKWGTNSQMEQGYVHIRQNSTEKDKLVVANICKKMWYNFSSSCSWQQPCTSWWPPASRRCSLASSCPACLQSIPRWERWWARAPSVRSPSCFATSSPPLLIRLLAFQGEGLLFLSLSWQSPQPFAFVLCLLL